MRFLDQQVTRPVTTRAAVDVEAVKLWLGSECIEVKESFHHAVSLGDEKLRELGAGASLDACGDCVHGVRLLDGGLDSRRIDQADVLSRYSFTPDSRHHHRVRGHGGANLQAVAHVTTLETCTAGIHALMWPLAAM
ncbi:MAG TPA: hypothetical protein VF082_03215 [Jiangellaceae bacterium]